MASSANGAHGTRPVSAICALVCVFLLAFAIAVSSAHGFASVAWADESQPASEAVQQGDESASDAAAAEGAGAADEATEGQETEVIEDDDVPLAASIAGSEPIPLTTINGTLRLVIVLSVVIVGVFFFIRSRRLNRNINKMERFIK